MSTQGLLDRFTRTDEMMAEMLPILRRIESGGINVQLQDDGASIQDILNLMEYQAEKNYEIQFFTYPNTGEVATLGTGDTLLDFQAGTIKDYAGVVTKMSNSLARLQIDFLRSIAINSNKNVIVQLDSKDKIRVKADNWFVGTYQQFTKVIITCTEETELFSLVCTNPEAIIEMVGEATLSIGREERKRIVSDKDTNFTGAIAQNANEKESLTGLEANELTIVSIGIQSDQPLNYRLWIFETDAFEDTDLDVDSFLEFVDFDLVTNNVQLGAANQYYYAITNLNIDYKDLDETNELHIALENLSATAKNAGATGEVKVQVKYIPRR